MHFVAAATVTTRPDAINIAARISRPATPRRVAGRSRCGDRKLERSAPRRQARFGIALLASWRLLKLPTLLPE
jgi:hypothetical protein